jgi:hypothetical protein
LIRAVVLAVVLFVAGCGREGTLLVHPPQPTGATTDIEISPGLLTAAQRAGVDLPALVESTLAKVEAQLHGRPPQITVGLGGLVVPEVGITGRTDPRDGSVHLTVSLDPRYNLRTTLERWLTTSLAHELDHSKRLIDGPGFDTALGSRMIFEGLASSFQRELYPDAIPPWTIALTSEQELAMWTKAKPLLNGVMPNDEAGTWFFGTGDIPRWTGYTIGYDIVRTYLDRHRDVTTAQLTLKDWRTILDQSGFDGRRF